MRQTGRLAKLAHEFGDRIAFVFVYTAEEAHLQAEVQATNAEIQAFHEQFAAAGIKIYGDGNLSETLCAWPTRAFFLDPDGRILFSSQGSWKGFETREMAIWFMKEGFWPGPQFGWDKFTSRLSFGWDRLWGAPHSDEPGCGSGCNAQQPPGAASRPAVPE